MLTLETWTCSGLRQYLRHKTAGMGAPFQRATQELLMRQSCRPACSIWYGEGRPPELPDLGPAACQNFIHRIRTDSQKKSQRKPRAIWCRAAWNWAASRPRAEDSDLELAARTGALMYRNAAQGVLPARAFSFTKKFALNSPRKWPSTLPLLRSGIRSCPTPSRPADPSPSAEKSRSLRAARHTGGCRCALGGAGHQAGDLYFQPTMLSNVSQDAEIVQEEVFGPVLVMQSFASDAQAIALANDSVYGLGGVCFGEEHHAQAVSNQVKTGFIWINSFGIRDLAAPFGGCKQSGIGREGGEWSFEFFCDVKDVIVPKKPFVPSFAHARRIARVARRKLLEPRLFRTIPVCFRQRSSALPPETGVIRI